MIFLNILYIVEARWLLRILVMCFPFACPLEPFMSNAFPLYALSPDALSTQMEHIQQTIRELDSRIDRAP